MGAESRGQVGGMEGSEAVRREFARESRAWRCRECGGGKSNEEVMREWWEVCREKGVEVDVEGCEVVGGVREESKKKTEERGEKEDGQSEAAAAAGDETTPAPATSASLSAVAPVSPVPSGSSHAPAVVPSTPSAQSNARPRPTPTTPAPVSAPAATATRTAAVTPSGPANSPWLDRAIIGIIFALIILIMKRVLNIDDL